MRMMEAFMSRAALGPGGAGRVRRFRDRAHSRPIAGSIMASFATLALTLGACGDGGGVGPGGDGGEGPDAVGDASASPDGGAPCPGEPTLEIRIVSGGTVLPGEVASFEVLVIGAEGDVDVRFTDPEGADTNGTAPFPTRIDGDRYEATLAEAGTQTWRVTVTDRCAEVDVPVVLRAAFPHVSFLNLVSTQELVAFGGPSGPERLSLNVVELDATGAARVRSGTDLPYLAASTAMDWPGRIARIGAYQPGDSEPLATLERDDLTPGADHVFVLHRDSASDGLRLTVVQEPQLDDPGSREAALGLLANLTAWPDALTLGTADEVLGAAVMPLSMSSSFALVLDDVPFGLTVDPAGLGFDMLTSTCRAFPGSPDGGVDLAPSSLIAPEDRVTFVAFSTPSGGLGLLGLGRTPDGAAFPMAFTAVPRPPPETRSAVFVANATDQPLRLRDDAGRAVGGWAEGGAVTPIAATLALDAEAWELVTVDGATAADGIALAKGEGARTVVWAWAGTEAEAPPRVHAERLERLEPEPSWSIGLTEGPGVVVGLGVDAVQPFAVDAESRSAMRVLGDESLLLTVSRSGVRWLLAASPGVVAAREHLVLMLPPEPWGQAMPMGLQLAGAAGGGVATTARSVPVVLTPHYVLEVFAPGSAPLRTAAPFPGARGWVPYGPNEDGLSGLGYRALQLTGAASFRVELALDVAAAGGTCADAVVVHRWVNGGEEVVPLDGPACGRDARTSFTVPAGAFSVGVVSDRLGDSTDSRGGGPWAGWRIETITPNLYPVEPGN